MGKLPIEEDINDDAEEIEDILEDYRYGFRIRLKLTNIKIGLAELKNYWKI